MIFLLHALFFLGGGEGMGGGWKGERKRERERERETGLENLFHQSVVAVKALETDDGFRVIQQRQSFWKEKKS